ncbi:MAG: hypothetical protein SFV15_16095 [Polyangiaceae bacterium]|nr:hypothetical protein [Polyangiaceae bacterium]
MKPLVAGSEIDAWCTKCRLDLGHRIVALIEGRPKRVICLTCSSEHNYRASQADAKADIVLRTQRSATSGPKKSKVPRVKSAADHTKDWESQIAGQATTAFIRYTIDRTFKPGQVLIHKTFGEGVVTDVLESDKMTVLFRTGPKTLVHSKTA